ncbi:MAG: CBS domain-containing protein [Candidatus Bathyarchaeota archaeon]|jgi:CBS domain-containing protein
MTENVVTTNKQTTIQEAAKILFAKRVGALVITDDKRKCEGIFTERDALRSLATKIPLNTQLMNVMSKNVITVRENASFAKAKSLMVSHGIRHLPVVDEEGYLTGMLTLRNALDELVGMSTRKV